MKKIGTFLLSSMLLLMNSCSETSSPGLEWLGDEVAVRFTTTLQPSVGIVPTRAMHGGTDLPTDGHVAVWGVRTQKDDIAVPAWKEATFHRQMTNKQYLIEEGNTLSPANGELDYHPFRDSLLTVYAYWPHTDEVDSNGCIPVNLTAQTDYLYTGPQQAQRDNEGEYAPIQLTFKHAMGAVAFRFYTESETARGETLNSLTLLTNYATEGIRLNIANGTFVAATTNNGSDSYTIDLTGQTVVYANTYTYTDITPFGYTMLPAGEEFCITGIRLSYGTGGNAEKDLTDTPITLQAGKVTVLNIKCASINAGYSLKLADEYN